MYISSIVISGFRNFFATTVNFQEGVNVIIGHNNAGKTNLLKSISLILDGATSRKLDIDDFNKNVTFDELKKNPPRVCISLEISESIKENLAGDDLVTVANWLVKLESPYLARLTYEFFLPKGDHDDYSRQLQTATDSKDAWNIIKHNFLRKYIHKIYAGNQTLKITADAEGIGKFDYQFLNAIRDVERDMFTGRNTLLREVVDFFIDYEIKNNGKTPEEKLNEIKAQKELFSKSANELLKMLQERMKEGQSHILKYAKDTGASFNEAEPDFDGSISEVDLYAALRLIIRYSTGIEIPATHNGLGYNNLIYMSLLLAKMQVDTNGDYLGSNAKVFPILVIEEPEAHLHPAMQYKFLKFLKENVQNKARQIFITSHSTHITSAVSLDEIICLSEHNSKLVIGYPGKVFSNSAEDIKSKAFVQRFLDATRSDMLFAKNIILVEGLAEQLLLSTLTRYHKKSIEDSHVAVINIGGRYFDHFLKMFDYPKPNTIAKRISCITDRDPEQQKPGGRSKACYPFETNLNAGYVYKENSGTNLALYSTHPSVRFFTQDKLKGKTLEYELLLSNPTCKLLLTESTGNLGELEKLMDAITAGKDLAQIESENILRESYENKRVIDALKSEPNGWTVAEILHSLVASRYLNSVGKGENALELAIALEDNLTTEKPIAFIVPTYITDAIDWVCL